MKKLYRSFTIIIVLLVQFVPAVALAQSSPSSVTQKVLAAQKDVRTIAMTDFRKIVDMPGNALLIDVREPGEYAAGHIPGTIKYPPRPARIPLPVENSSPGFTSSRSNAPGAFFFNGGKDNRKSLLARI
jgi:hypothetical protein